MSTYKCEFCNNEYTNNKILKNHQKTAKFCIEIQKKTQNETNIQHPDILNYQCEFCKDTFTLKHVLERHHQTCKIKLEKIKEENDQKKDELIIKLKEEINSLNNIIYLNKNEINNYKTDILVFKTKYEEQLKMKEEQLNMKDEIVKELKKEIQTLKQESKETYNTFFEKEEKLVDTLLHQNNSMSKNFNGNVKTVQNLTIHNYGIKPLTQESVIGAFDSYNSKNKNAFNGYVYDLITGDHVSFKVEHVFYGIIKELKDYYGITDISREKIIFNNNGEMTLTTIQEFIRTNIVMNNINIILEWIMNLQTQIKNKKDEGLIDSNGEIREMTEREKRDLTDKASTLEYVYKMFNISKERGHPNETMSKFLSDGAMEHGKVVGKVKQIKSDILTIK
jgi:hypothetical protein